MNILWIKDGKLGHEKQVKVLLDELSRTIDIKVFEEEYIIGSFQRITDIYNYATHQSNMFIPPHVKYHKKNIHLIIGAGSNVHARILQIKRGLKHDFNDEVLAISLLVPSFFKKHFDLICAPKHDRHKLSGHEAIYFEGSLAKVSIDAVDESIGLIAIGGKNQHYLFNINKIMEQIEFVTSIYPNKAWYIFPSRRTPHKMIQAIKKLAQTSKKIIVSEDGFDELLRKASIKIITQDSMNMVYESLSTKGSTVLFHMKYLRKNKVINQMNELLHNKQVGYIEYNQMVKGLNKTKIHMQNPHHEVYAEVEKLAYKIKNKFNLS
jgi:mitochondrial fission protein ELM1